MATLFVFGFMIGFFAGLLMGLLHQRRKINATIKEAKRQMEIGRALIKDNERILSSPPLTPNK